MNHLIEQQSQLKELIPLFAELSEQQGYIAVDTEFLREKTYNAKLCLVQLGIGENQYCIDVLAIDDLSSLTELFANQRITKIFHAARQDMEVIYQTLGVLPQPIYDTQLAAAFSGLDMQTGYSALVKAKLDLELPQSQARTDWTRRPLSEVQLAYAAEDVVHLEFLYQDSQQSMAEQGKSQWYQQELDTYYDISKYVIEPSEAWRRLNGGGLNKAQQYTLQALAAWREETAQTRNIPRTWVVRDDALFDLAAKRPTTVDEVKDLEVFGRKSVNRLAPIVANVIAQVEVGEALIWARVEPLDKQQKKFCSSMMKQLASYAEQHHIAQGLLATRKDIESLYRHRRSKKLLEGWRESVVGQPLLEYIQSEAG